MILIIPYNRENAVQYAQRWALARNPAYYNFDGLGGDCTNFASQCLFVGSGIMNYTKDTGWYYNSPYDRAAAWTHAQYLNNFLKQNKGAGPVVSVQMQLEPGDLIQLSNGTEVYHTLVVVDFESGEPIICAHTDDSFRRPLSTYYYAFAEGLHITGINEY